MPSELGLDTNLQRGCGVGSDEIASDEQLRCNGVKTETSICFGCQTTESNIIIGVNLSCEDIFGVSVKFPLCEKLISG